MNPAHVTFAPVRRRLVIGLLVVLAFASPVWAGGSGQGPDPSPRNPDPERAAKWAGMDTPVSGTTRLRRLDDTGFFVQPGEDLAGLPTDFTFYGRFVGSSRGGPAVRGRRGTADYVIDCQGVGPGGGFERTVVAEGRALFDRDGGLVIHERAIPQGPCEFAGIDVDYGGNMRLLGDGTLQEGFRVSPAPDGACPAGPNTLCLQDGRFAVEVDWAQNRDSGMGAAIPRSDSDGTFWFFDSSNSELIVKVLDGCGTPFNSFWFFAGGLTNVEFELTVTDTQTNVSRIYTNPAGTPFQPIQDTAAFATCP